MSYSLRRTRTAAFTLLATAALAACGSDGTGPGADCARNEGGQLVVFGTTVKDGGQALNIGSSSTGSLSSADCEDDRGSHMDVYKLEVSAQEQVVITLQSADFDPYLFLVDADGDILVQNDDEQSGSTNSQIEYTLQPGTYYINASSFLPEETGDYVLAIQNSGGSGCRLASVSVGGSVSGGLATTDCAFEDGSFYDAYSLVLTSQRTVTIDMGSASFDTYLFLLDDQFGLVQENDDVDTANGNTDSRISVTLPAGTYYIVANSYLSAQTGAYTLSVQ